MNAYVYLALFLQPITIHFSLPGPGVPGILDGHAQGNVGNPANRVGGQRHVRPGLPVGIPQRGLCCPNRYVRARPANTRSVAVRTDGVLREQETNDLFARCSKIDKIACVHSELFSWWRTLRDAIHEHLMFYLSFAGYGKENIGRNAKFLQGPMTEGYMVEEIVESLRHADPLFCKLQNHKPDGSVYQLCLCLTPVFNVDGESGEVLNHCIVRNCCCCLYVKKVYLASSATSVSILF